ncbi:MAG: hydrolase 1, exosortase A system-associated [Novosphingobium sp.]|nr:hydrolase 1, exosortase A system-associated [Novosphingobium sp.]
MTRRHLTFACQGAQLAATLDEANGASGLLIVSGGNEIRSGAFSGQAHLAARIAAVGHPVFRFDRRGVGDSGGTNSGFRSSAPDIAAALTAFRREAPQLQRIAAFGICDAASALMLAHGAGCDTLVLANPWTSEGSDALPPPAAIRARYAEKLRNPAEIRRLASGKVSFKGLMRGLASALKPQPAPTTLAGEMATGLRTFPGRVRILLSGRDRTAQIFEAAWDKADLRLAHCPGASHAFAEQESADWLFEQILASLSE